MGTHGIFRVPEPFNEPVRAYEPGSPEREELRRRLDDLSSQRIDIPLAIGGEEGGEEGVKNLLEERRGDGFRLEAGGIDGANDGKEFVPSEIW